MSARIGFAIAALAAVTLPGVTAARGLSVEIRTDRGADAVYTSGERIEISARTSDDAYLLVYEIDTEGGIHILFPGRGEDPRVEGRDRLRLPRAYEEWVVEGAVGEGFIVAVASDRPFLPLPWYLRPYNVQADDVGYFGRDEGEELEDEGVTAEGRIVGDPFVAMERIRRRVLEDPDDPESFASAYTTYYLHERVRYPRYVCYDCHRPGHWAWWDGFDPYYTTCSVFDMRVNWHWGWGPSYWFGRVPYFVYVYRADCPPYYRRWHRAGHWYGSWHGWKHWRGMWGAHLVRYKSPPPRGYVPPDPRDRNPDPRWKSGRPTPPGYIATRLPREPAVGVMPTRRARDDDRSARPGPRDLRDRSVRAPRDPAVTRDPVRVTPGDDRNRITSPRDRSVTPTDRPLRVPPSDRILRPRSSDPPAPPRIVTPKRDRTPATPEKRPQVRERPNDRREKAPEAKPARPERKEQKISSSPSKPRGERPRGGRDKR